MTGIGDYVIIVGSKELFEMTCGVNLFQHVWDCFVLVEKERTMSSVMSELLQQGVSLSCIVWAIKKVVSDGFYCEASAVRACQEFCSLDNK